MASKLDTHIAVGKKLAAARQGSQLSQAAAAAALGVPQSRVARIELGERRLLLTEAAQYAALYGVPMTSFLPDA